MFRTLRNFFNSEAHPTHFSTRVLAALPFLAVLISYLVWSFLRHADNPADKLVPSLLQIFDAAIQVASTPDRLGKIWLWIDLPATAERFGLDLLFCSTGIIFGLLMGIFPYVEALLLRFVIAIDKIVAISLLPLVMILFGIGLYFHVGLVVFAIWPTIVLTAFAETKGYADQLKIKARTLGASHWELAFRVVLPGIMPKMLDALRLNFKSIAGLVIAAEMIVASEGLGFRIALVKRFSTMDIVIVYVIIITALLFIADVLVTRFIAWRYPWYNKD